MAVRTEPSYSKTQIAVMDRITNAWQTSGKFQSGRPVRSPIDAFGGKSMSGPFVGLGKKMICLIRRWDPVRDAIAMLGPFSVNGPSSGAIDMRSDMPSYGLFLLKHEDDKDMFGFIPDPPLLFEKKIEDEEFDLDQETTEGILRDRLRLEVNSKTHQFRFFFV